jgi:hypothetical protein
MLALIKVDANNSLKFSNLPDLRPDVGLPMLPFHRVTQNLKYFDSKALPCNFPREEARHNFRGAPIGHQG